MCNGRKKKLFVIRDFQYFFGTFLVLQKTNLVVDRCTWAQAYKFFCSEHIRSHVYLFLMEKNYHKYKQFKILYCKYVWMGNIKYSKQFIIIRLPTIRNGFHRFVYYNVSFFFSLIFVMNKFKTN